MPTYEKFVIVTRSRTGSNLLITLLNCHENIETENEIFARMNGKSSEEIWDVFFNNKPQSILSVGFKIFYYHPLDSADKRVWDFIDNDQRIKIIHLTRKNRLRTHISRIIANNTGVWFEKRNENRAPIENKQICVDLDSCLKEFKSTENFEEKTRNRFKNHPFLEISYESLVDDKQSVMNDLFTFLGVKPVKVSSNLKRQNSESIKDLVINFESLKTMLEKNNYSAFLD